MERRKILLGSGAALATALAGCSGDETSDGSDDENGGSDPNGNGDANGDENGGDKDTDGTETDDIPGFDGKKLDVGSDAISVKQIDKKGDKIEILVETDITDREKLYAELEHIANHHDDAIVDLEAFIAEIKTVEWIIEHEKTTVASFYVNVDWIVDYLEDDISKDDFYDKVKQTAE
ncbi:hypothetical protein [Natronorubrum sp. FCH18a]|uniref:hypothetical protein n=1 Tax=Natronorubrum sp. FCH18a TaxID=3447018 RepID=UPI003F512654